MGLRPGDRNGLREEHDEYGTSRNALDDNGPAVPRDGFVGPGSKGFGSAAHRQEHLTGPVCWHGDCDPPDRSDETALRANGHISPAFRTFR